MPDELRASPAVPVLDTGRLVLRGHRLDDFADYVALWADPVVTRYIGGRPSSEEETWTRLLRGVGHWSLMGFGYWAIIEKASGRFAGEVGFVDLKRSIQPSLAGAPENGWVLAPWAQGRGLATEAVQAAIDWGAPRFGERRMVCLIHPDNHASLRVAEKCGYRERARTVYKGDPTLVLER